MNYIDFITNIHTLILQHQYEKALASIDTTLPFCQGNLKELINLKASILLAMHNYQEALSLYQGTCIYTLLDATDISSFNQLAIIHKHLDHPIHSQIMTFISFILAKDTEAITTYTDPIYQKISNLTQLLLTAPATAELYYELALHYALSLQITEACIYYLAYEHLGGTSSTELFELIMHYQHFNRFYEMLKTSKHTFCLLNYTTLSPCDYSLLAKTLALLGHRTYMIMPPTPFSVDTPVIALESLIPLSFQHAKLENTITTLVPLLPTYQNTSLGDTTLLVLDKLQSTYCVEDSFILLGNTAYLHNLIEDSKWYKVLQRAYVDPLMTDYPSSAIYYMGNYVYTASKIYQFDVASYLLTPSEVNISVIVPTKGCVYTLEHTLKTCLEQTYDDFEVIVSDNSPQDNLEVLGLVKRLNHPKLKYFKTPFELSLGKSFEFAYLHAKGNFVFSIGSDDALLPYSLQHIANILEQNPDQNILQWAKLFYAWPDQSSMGRADLFSFPTDLQKNQVSTYYISSIKHINYVIQLLNERTTGLLGLPMCYMNSGMRKKHILDIINLTGKFINSSVQDVYLGILNMTMYDLILFIDYPLVIGGVSNNSIVIKPTLNDNKLTRYKDYILEYNRATEFVDLQALSLQRLLFPLSDGFLFVHELLKIMSLSLNNKPNDWNEQIDFKNLLEWGVLTYYQTNHIYIDFVKLLEQSAILQGESTYEWFHHFIKAFPSVSTSKLSPSLSPSNPKDYTPGLQGTTLTIDANLLGISNIYEASQFFTHLFNL